MPGGRRAGVEEENSEISGAALAWQRIKVASAPLSAAASWYRQSKYHARQNNRIASAGIICRFIGARRLARPSIQRRAR